MIPPTTLSNQDAAAHDNTFSTNKQTVFGFYKKDIDGVWTQHSQTPKSYVYKVNATFVFMKYESDF